MMIMIPVAAIFDLIKVPFLGHGWTDSDQIWNFYSSFSFLARNTKTV